MDKFGQDVTAIITAIITVAVIAVVLSNGANTVNVILSFFQGMTALLGVAISPITGQSVNSGGSLTAGWSNTGTGGFSTSVNGLSGAVGSAAGGLLSGLFSGSSGITGNLGGSSGGSSGGSIDSGSWDTGGSSSAISGLVDSGSWD